MRKPHRKWQVLSLGLLVSLAGTAALQQAVAASAPPVFSPTAQTAWVGIGIGALLPVPGSPKPIGQDPAHRYISNDEAGVTGRQPTQRISDTGNPNLKQWAKDVMKKDNDEVLAGKFAFTARSSCRAAGVPGFDLLLGGALFILQSPTEVTMVFSGNAETRHIWLNAQHSANLKPSWYGESVGHYEGETLVIDTVGIKIGPFSMIDWYGTPYTELLHVIERYRLIEYEAAKEAEERGTKENLHMPLRMSGATGLAAAADYNKGKALQLQFTIEDEGVFTMPWSATITYWRSFDQWREFVCAESLRATYVTEESAIPRADKPDF